MRTTYHANPQTAERNWVHMDAEGQVLGRLASKIAVTLMGKHKPTYTPHVDTGDFVVVTNSEKIVLTGRKAETKVYRHHTGYIGHLREHSFERVMERDPTKPLFMAVKRMLPKTKLGRTMLSKLKIHAGPDHPHGAQAPVTKTP